MNPRGFADWVDVIREQKRRRKYIHDKKQEYKEKERALRTKKIEFKKLQFQKNLQIKKQ